MNPKEILLRLVAVRAKFEDRHDTQLVELVNILIDGFGEGEKVEAGLIDAGGIGS